MTFKEAAKILNADTYTDKEVSEATAAIRWYENNTLELEDYETDQFYILVDKLNKKK